MASVTVIKEGLKTPTGVEPAGDTIWITGCHRQGYVDPHAQIITLQYHHEGDPPRYKGTASAVPEGRLRGAFTALPKAQSEMADYRS